jgi:hypothetical protein
MSNGSITLLYHVAEISRNIIDEIRSYEVLTEANDAFCERLRQLRDDDGYPNDKQIEEALRAGHFEMGEMILSICGGKVEKAE